MTELWAVIFSANDSIQVWRTEREAREHAEMSQAAGHDCRWVKMVEAREDDMRKCVCSGWECRP